MHLNKQEAVKMKKGDTGIISEMKNDGKVNQKRSNVNTQNIQLWEQLIY